MKKILYKLLGLIIILAAAIVFFADSIGKNYAQEYAKNLLKTPVTISQFNSNLLNKNLNIDFIKVQNPPNFKNKNALSLNHFSLKVGDIDNNLIVIDEIKLDGLEFILEQNSNKVNLTQLLNNLEKPSQNTKSTTSTSKSKTQEKRIKIKQLKVSNINLKIDTKWVKSTLKAPNISVRNFGGNSGVELSQIGKKVAKEILHNLKQALEKQGIEAGKKEIEANLRRKIEQKLGVESDKLKDKAKDLFKNLGF